MILKPLSFCWLVEKLKVNKAVFSNAAQKWICRCWNMREWIDKMPISNAYCIMKTCLDFIGCSHGTNLTRFCMRKQLILIVDGPWSGSWRGLKSEEGHIKLPCVSRCSYALSQGKGWDGLLRGKTQGKKADLESQHVMLQLKRKHCGRLWTTVDV